MLTINGHNESLLRMRQRVPVMKVKWRMFNTNAHYECSWWMCVMNGPKNHNGGRQGSCNEQNLSRALTIRQRKAFFISLRAFAISTERLLVDICELLLKSSSYLEGPWRIMPATASLALFIFGDGFSPKGKRFSLYHSLYIYTILCSNSRSFLIYI